MYGSLSRRKVVHFNRVTKSQRKNSFTTVVQGTSTFQVFALPSEGKLDIRGNESYVFLELPVASESTPYFSLPLSPFLSFLLSLLFLLLLFPLTSSCLSLFILIMSSLGYSRQSWQALISSSFWDKKKGISHYPTTRPDPILNPLESREGNYCRRARGPYLHEETGGEGKGFRFRGLPHSVTGPYSPSRVRPPSLRSIVKIESFHSPRLRCQETGVT